MVYGIDTIRTRLNRRFPTKLPMQDQRVVMAPKPTIREMLYSMGFRDFLIRSIIFRRESSSSIEDITYPIHDYDIVISRVKT